jgi:predicted RNA-binding protein YlqC (UPF0109 family)
MKGLVERMARAVVNDPDAVVVREIKDAGGTTYKLIVPSDDMGRVIGRGGRIANAMRTLLRVSAGVEGRRVMLDIESAEADEEDQPGMVRRR